MVVAGTDTGVGKTVFAAALVRALGADYWKPIQAGLEGPTDSEHVAELAAADGDRVVPERYRLTTPVSPHLAAEVEGIEIGVEALQLPAGDNSLVVELAGGLMVPLTRSVLQVDLVASWRVPVVLVARTTLGTINHALLSLEAMRARGIEVLGVAFVGDENGDSEITIAELGKVKRLGRLPFVDPLTGDALAAEFESNFVIEDFK
ncbi:MAG: dethiobiotin synthase [Alphaproteobacteria bacterium]|nr:dethiobiotin synthase [Alphaproteobacteria bacterium]